MRRGWIPQVGIARTVCMSAPIDDYILFITGMVVFGIALAGVIAVLGRMDTDERDMELVRMIILLAHTLGMEVVGEGIESESQVDLLRDLNCEFGQGYFFAKPLSEEAAYELLTAPPEGMALNAKT